MKTKTTRALALTAFAFAATGSLLHAEAKHPDKPADKAATKAAKAAKAAPAKAKKGKKARKAEQTAKAPAQPQTAKKAPASEEKDPARANIEAAQSRLALENSLHAEVAKKELADLRQKVARLKLEKEALAETLAVADLKQKQALMKDDAKFKKETAALSREATLAKIEAEKLSATLKATQAEFSLERAANDREKNYAESEPVYLADPFLKDGTLVISDRRIDLNGPIFPALADHVTERINFFNNKNTEHPIFVVIDSSPGGSVMSGMSIMRAMHGSEAPVYVVVKTFAASMAASLTTLAERSFAFPNAIILHHQVLAPSYGNLSETREHTRQMEEWWRRLANPIAKKMGISREEFIEKMYENTVTGDWTEFADQARKLKWVDHVVSNIKETSLLKNPDAKRSAPAPTAEAGTPTPANLIPRLNPKDMLYMYNPDGFYKPQP